MIARTHCLMHKIPSAGGLVFVGGTTAGGAGDAYTSVSLTSLTGGIASAPATGDIVIVVHGWATTSDGDPTISGYTELAELYSDDTRDANAVVAYKVMGASPDTSVTVPNTGSSSDGLATAVHVWRGINATPIDATTTTATGNNSDRPNSPAITPVTTGAYVLTLGLGAQGTSAGLLTAPAGYTDNDFVATGTGGSRQAMAVIASKAWISGAENPGNWNAGEADTADSWVAFTVALRPA